MEKKTGIFICEGCGIGEALDTGRLASEAEAAFHPGLCMHHRALCSRDGAGRLHEAVADRELDQVVIAACGKGTKDAALDAGRETETHRVNIRELVAWGMEPGTEDTYLAAFENLQMAVAGAKYMQHPQPYIPETVSREILVVGAGITGMTAALEGAGAGYHVHLVEKSDQPGGWARQWKKQIPFREPFDVFPDPVVHDLVEKVKGHGNITLHTHSGIGKIEGQPGQFRVHLENGKDTELMVGAVVAAQGFMPYTPPGEDFFGYRQFPQVITTTELEQRVKSDALNEVSSVLFIQCAGSRDPEHLPYCSSICCGITLKQTRYVLERYPDAVVYILYKDIRTPGFLESFYREMQNDPRVILVKGAYEGMEGTGNQVRVTLHNQLIDERMQVAVDQVVLATGMVPAGTEDLNLSYRLGTGMPELKYAFPDSHFICFPYESRRTGIYAAGTVRAPMGIPAAQEDAGGAMLKAIQTIEAVARGEAVHPRSGDRNWPQMYMERCTDCKRCTEECPFGTYDETEQGTPVLNPTRCRRCGICIGSCPERVIGFDDYSINSTSARIKAIDMPDEFDERPRVLAFVCENDALPALLAAVREKRRLSPWLRIIPVRCLGSVNQVWISDALSKGYDGILQIGCKPGDDYQCHFIHGSELSEKRGENMEETLSTMMLEPERIRTAFVEITETEKIIGIIDDYMEEIELIGPNPFKDM